MITLKIANKRKIQVPGSDKVTSEKDLYPE